MCVWQGFMASAPGHPILADAIETIVNQVRNKFTSADITASFCPNPDISLLLSCEVLLITGPCLLGASINRVLGRHGHMQFDPGEILSSTGQPPVPGRTVILDQKREEVTNFIRVEREMTVIATEMFVGEDKGHNNRGTNYAAGQRFINHFGEDHVYANDHKANEDIRIVVPSGSVP
jgi:hypothetical protein